MAAGAGKPPGKKKPARKSAPAQKTPAQPGDIPDPEKVYRGIFESGGIPTAIVGEDLVIRLANARFLELAGFPRNEVEGKKRWTDFVSTADVEKTGQYIAENLRPGGWAPSLFSFGFVDRNGLMHDVAASMSRMAGSPLIIIALTDLASRKKVERLLRLNEERYQKLVRTLSTGVFRAMYDEPGRLVWANPAFLAMFSFGSLDTLPRVTFAGLFRELNDRQRAWTNLEERGFSRMERIRLTKLDGSPFWASVTLDLRQNEEGTASWIDGTVEDITDRVVAGEELRHTRSRMGEILGAVTTYGLFVTDPDGILTMFNTGAERMLGYHAEDLLGRETPLAFLAPQPAIAGTSREEGFSAFIAGARVNGVDEREWMLRKGDGTSFPADVTLSIMRDGEGTVTGYLGVIQEISDRIRIEEAFRHDKLQMSGVLYHVPDPTFALDRAGKIIAWNRAIEDLSGVKAVEILGKGNYEHAVALTGERNPMLADLVFSRDEEIRLHGYTKITRRGNAVSAETPPARITGTVMRATAAPIYDDAGEISGAIQSMTDVTDVWKRESELQDSISRFRAILDHIGLAIAILDEHLTLTYINPEFERITGYVHDEVEGKRRLAEFIAPDEPDELRTLRRRPDGQVIPVRERVRFIRWDGQIRNGHLSVKPMPETGFGVLSLFDITDRVQAEEAVQRANEKLNFFSSITRHDILNQLTALKANLELAREASAGDDQRTGLIDKELTAAQGIQNLILFTRDYQDIGIQPPEWQDVREVILKSCAGIRLGGITVAVPVSGVEIYADLLLERVFYHLINNAIQHGGDSLTEIRFAGTESFDEYVLACEDNGIGIPPEAKERIFTRQPYIGSGLGLFISREILSITGIGIRETGTPGEGARFEIRIPRGAYRFTGSAGHQP